MEHSRKMMQIPTSHSQQYIGNGARFQSLPPPDGGFYSVSDRGVVGFGNLPPSIDVDQSLSDVFSLINLSPATYTDRPPFVQTGVGGEIGCSHRAGEGFIHSLNSPRVVHSDLGVNSFYDRQRWYDDMRRHCSRFDYEVEFDHCLHPHNQNLQLRSQYVEESSVKQLRGKIYTLAKDQNGCRILQAMFDRSSIEELEFVFSELLDYISDLMKDQFGNYLVQKLVSLWNDDQKTRLILSLTEIPTSIILVCMNPHGTRAVQKLLENLNPNQVKLLMKALCMGAATLAVDPNGHHVIQYCLINFHSDIIKPILTEIANQCYKIATDRSGCCVLQACVEHSRGELRIRIITEIMADSLHLAEDPFGNYVLQHMVGLDVPELTALLVRQLQGNFASLSCNKYASNVVEKCLNESGEDISARIIMELVKSPNSSMLLLDPYANFVIQSALKVSKGYAHECLCGLISKNMASMRTNLYGKKILERFEKKRVNFV